MMEKEKPTASELRQYLKDAGSYDATLNDNEMFELYNALELSKSTASQEKEQRSILEETEDNCNAIKDLIENSVLVEDVVNDTSQSTQDPFEDEDFELSFSKAKENAKNCTSKSFKIGNNLKTASSNINNYCIDFNNVDTYHSVPTTHKPLKQIVIEPKYKFPIYCRSEILALSYEEREHLIADFHSKILSDLTYHHRQSMHFVAWGKPIQASCNFNGSLDKKPEVLSTDDVSGDGDNDLDDNGIFISRAGRQTKRKLYTENKDENINRNEQPLSSNTVKEPPVKKRPNLSTLKNEEIIKHSKLFSDSPTRAEKMFDKLLEEESKKVQAEEEVEAFKNSLRSTSDEENGDSDIPEVVHSEEPFTKRRIDPPSLKKGGPKTRASIRGARGGGRKHTKISDKTPGSDTQYAPLETTQVTPNKTKIKKGPCPLCGEQFFQNELEVHASACGEIDAIASTVTTRKRAGLKQQTITCEICDEVFLLSTAYEVHVKECLARSQDV